MKKILTYTLLAACILALSACSHKPLDPPAPEIEVDETAPISFTTGVAGTKGLIESDAAFSVANTQLQVFDFMTVGTGTSAQTVKYIDDQIAGKASGAWDYVNGGPYYWTKTGTHKFFGYLTQGPGGTSDTFVGTTTMSGQELAVGGTDTEDGKLTLTPATAKQFDFLYSDYQSYTMPERPVNTYVELRMKHLFTALAVDVINNTDITLKNLSVKFTGVHPTQSATIDWDTNSPVTETVGTGENARTYYYPNPVYAPTPQTAATAADMPLGKLGADLSSGDTAHLYSGYALLWPQDILSAVPATEATEGTEATPAFAGSQVSISYDGSTARAANLSNLKDAGGNPITKFEAGKKYLLTITVKPLEVIFNIQVKPLDNMNAVEDNPEIFYVES